MANKGPLDAKIDVGALNEIIVYANQYRQEVTEKTDAIRNLCNQMAENESLSGGDGDVIRDNFAKIATGCSSLDRSTEFIVKTLNDKLGVAIQMRHSSSIGSSTESMDKAASTVGVLKKD